MTNRLFGLFICLGLLFSATTLYYIVLPGFTYTECLTWAMAGFVAVLLREDLARQIDE
jgi:hypothetical protein